MALLTRTPKESTTPEPVTDEVVRHRFKTAAREQWADFRSSRRVRFLMTLAVGMVLGSLLLPISMYLWNGVKIADLQAEQQTQLTQMQQQIDQFANSCAQQGDCKTMPFERASEVAQMWATACFNYSSVDANSQQAARLKNAGGPDSCGMVTGTGSGTVYPDSSIRLTVPDANNAPRADLGLVGVHVVMAGQPVPFLYVAPAKATASGVRIESAGGIYTTPPTFTVTNCEADNTDAGQAYMSRIQSLEAGRVGTPNIDHTDYLAPGRKLDRYGPTVKSAKVTGIVVCREGSVNSKPNKTMKRVVVSETISGPVPKSQFKFHNAYKLVLINGKWFIDAWGPVAESELNLN